MMMMIRIIIINLIFISCNHHQSWWMCFYVCVCEQKKNEIHEQLISWINYWWFTENFLVYQKEWKWKKNFDPGNWPFLNTVIEFDLYASEIVGYKCLCVCYCWVYFHHPSIRIHIVVRYTNYWKAIHFSFFPGYPGFLNYWN